MDSGQALAELVGTSSQVELALAFDREGRSIAIAPEAGDETARSLARSAASIVDGARDFGGESHGEPVQIELAYREASILVAREDDLCLMALTSPDPIAALVFFDLKTCLARIGETEEKGRGPSVRGLGRRVRRWMGWSEDGERTNGSA
jgi:hypothetical protein